MTLSIHENKSYRLFPKKCHMFIRAALKDSARSKCEKTTQKEERL